MEKKPALPTTERFSVEPQGAGASGLSEQSMQLLDQLVSLLRAEGGEQNLELASTLEAGGWAALSETRIQLLMQQLRAMPHAGDHLLAQAGGGVLNDGRTPPAGVTLPGLRDTGDAAPARPALESDNAPATPAPRGPDRSFGDQILDQLAAGSVQSVTNPTQIGAQSPVSVPANPSASATNADANAPTMGASIVAALGSGAVPVVSGSTETQASAGGAVPATPPATPPTQAPGNAAAQAASGTLPAPGSAPAPGPSSMASGPADGGSGGMPGSASGNTVSRMPATSSLGTGAPVVNASFITPFVEQKVSATGSLLSEAAVPGSTDASNTKNSTSFVRPTTAEVGSNVLPIANAQAREQSAPLAPPAPPEAPNPFGSATFVLGNTEAEGAGPLGPKEFYEGTSSLGATLIPLVITRVNPMMPDSLPFEIRGISANDLQGIVDAAGVAITLTESADGVLRGFAQFAGGQKTQTLTLKVAQDAAPEDDEQLAVTLFDGTFVRMPGGQQQIEVVIVDDDSPVWLDPKVTITSGRYALNGDGIAVLIEDTGEDPRLALDDEGDPILDDNGNPTLIEGSSAASGAARELIFTVYREDTTLAKVASYTLQGIASSDLAWGSLSSGVRFEVGQEVAYVHVYLKQDARWDADTTLALQLKYQPAQPDPDRPTRTGIELLDDDGWTYSLDTANVGAFEGNPVTGGNENRNNWTSVVFTIKRDPRMEGAALDSDSVSWEVSFADGTVNAADIRETRGTVDFAAGETEKPLVVYVRKDPTIEPSELLTVKLTGTTTAAPLSRIDPTKASETMTIINDDPTVGIDLEADGTANVVFEGNEIVFVVRRATGLDYTGPNGGPLVIDWTLVPKSLGDTSLPSAGNRSGSVDFYPGETEKIIRVRTQNDELVNGDQRYYLAITCEDPKVQIAGSVIEGLVMSNDVDISVTSIEALGLDDAGLATYTATITRTGALGFAHSVTWDLYGVGENPARTEDFRMPADGARVISFAAQSDSSVESDTQTITFKALPGMIVDGARGFEVKLTDRVGDDVLLGTSAARGTIIPNGVSVSVVAVQSSLLEGSSEATDNAHQFRVTLSDEALGDVKVNWKVIPYTTNAADSVINAERSDFGGTYPSGSVTIAEGDLESALISVLPSWDNEVEANQRFYVQIELDATSASLGGVAVDRALGVIVNDDALVGFASADMTFNGDEGAADAQGSVQATVTRTGFARSNVTVNWHVELIGSGIPAEDRAALDDFFEGLPSGYVEMVSGQTAVTIDIPVNGDNRLENSEKFRIVLDSVTGGAQLLEANRVATGRVVNDDAVIFMVQGSQTELEGQGGTRILEVLVQRETAGARLPSASFQWEVALPSSAESLATTADFSGNRLPRGAGLFQAGETTAKIQITLTADNLVEGDDSFVVNLTGTNANQHMLSADPALLTTLVTLGNDDDVVSFDPAASNLSQVVLEDGAGHLGQELVYTLTRTGFVDKETAVNWSLNLGSGANPASPSDFLDSRGFAYADRDSFGIPTAVGGTATFASGSDTAEIRIRVNPDIVLEESESFTLALASTDLAANGSTLASSNTSASGQLTNDDLRVTATLDRLTQAEDDVGQSTTFTYTLTRSGAIEQDTDIHWVVQGSRIVLDPDGANPRTLATRLSDEEITSVQEGDLSWSSTDGVGATRTITVIVAGDAAVEANEAFELVVTNNPNGYQADVSGANGIQGAVIDNDAIVSIEAYAASMSEGSEGQTRSITFKVTRSGDLSQAITVALNVTGTTSATGPPSVTLPAGDQEAVTLTFADGRTETYTLRGDKQTVDVAYTIAGDNLLETGEKLQVALGTISGVAAGHNVTIASGKGSATTLLTNDDIRIYTTVQTVAAPGSGNPTDTVFNAVTQRYERLEGWSADSPGDPHNTVTYTLSRDGDSSLRAIELSWRVLPSGTFVVDAEDFGIGQDRIGNDGLPSGRVTFAEGATTASAPIVITLSGDQSVEPSEGMALRLTSSDANVEFDPITEDRVYLKADDSGFSVVSRGTKVDDGVGLFHREVDEGNDPSAKRYVEFDLSGIGVAGTKHWKVSGATAADFVDGTALTGSFTYDDLNPSTLVRLELRQDSLVNVDVEATLTLYNDAVFSSPITDLASRTVRDSVTIIDEDAQVSIRATTINLTSGAVWEGNDANLDSVATTSTATNRLNGTDEYLELRFEVDRGDNVKQVSTVPWSVALTANSLNAADFWDLPTTETASGWYDAATHTVQGWVEFPALLDDGENSDEAQTQTITLRVVRDWLEEGNETVQVVLGTPSAGTSLTGGSQSAQTVIKNDDATVQFTSNYMVNGGAPVTHDEGNGNISGTPATTSFTFSLTRTGYTDQTSTVYWDLDREDINIFDFYPLAPSVNYGMPTGEVVFAFGETTKSITVDVVPDDFTQVWWPYTYPTTPQQLEGDETFTVELHNGSWQPASYGQVLVTSPGTAVVGRPEAQAIIVNDDVQIQITNVRTNLPEGTGPSTEAGRVGDVNPALDGVQRYIEHSITFERQGDPRQAVSFSWQIDLGTNELMDSNGAVVVNGMPGIGANGEYDIATGADISVASSLVVTAGAVTGTIFWAAGETGSKTIIFRPEGDDTVEDNIGFVLYTTANSPLIDEFTSSTGDTTVVNSPINDSKALARFNIFRDEAKVWVSNEIVSQYVPSDSIQASMSQTYRAFDNYPYDTWWNVDYNYSGNPTDPNNTFEGSLGTAAAGSDYAATSRSLTFSEAARTQTVQVAITNDSTYETSEALGLFLSGAQRGSIGDSQSTITLADNDSSVQGHWLKVFGNTGIEGVDASADFRVDLGQALTQDTRFTFEFNQSGDTAAQTNDEDGEGDYSRYFEYSTDGGLSWQTNAPVYQFDYVRDGSSLLADHATLVYELDNTFGSGWDNWLDFGDLKQDAGYRVGEVSYGKSRGGASDLYNIVVGGCCDAWFDGNGNGLRDAVEADAYDFEEDEPLFDIADGSYTITFMSLPGEDLNLDGFGADDRIRIDMAAMRSHPEWDEWFGNRAYRLGSIQTKDDWSRSGGRTGSSTWEQRLTGFDSCVAVNLRSDYWDTNTHDNRVWVVAETSDGDCSCTRIVRFDSNTDIEGQWHRDVAGAFEQVSFVNYQSDGGQDNTESYTVWIPVRADVTLDPDALGVRIDGSGGEMTGAIGGVLSLDDESDEALALREEFLAWWDQAFNEEGSNVDDVLAYFAQFAARLSDAPQAQFVKVDIEWDGFGVLSWSVDGLDAADVLAPQDDSVFSALQLLQDVTVAAGNSRVDADIELAATAALCEVNTGISAVDALEPEVYRPAFEVLTDQTDDQNVRTVTMVVTRPAGLGADAVSYTANFPETLTAEHLLEGSAAISGVVQFAAGQTRAELTFIFDAEVVTPLPEPIPHDIRVIVDHNPNTDVVGAYIDTDRDGVLDASEAVSANLAFSSRGNDLVDLATNRVTIRFNDLPDAPLDFVGFGADDRIELNTDEMARNGWLMGFDGYERTREFGGDTASHLDCDAASSELSQEGRTVWGQNYSWTLYASRPSVADCEMAYLEFQGCNTDGSPRDCTSRTVRMAEFGSSRRLNPIIDGTHALFDRVSFVQNPTIHVVVDSEGAYVDDNADGVHQEAETTLAFDAEGQDLIGIRFAPVVLRFADTPDTPLNLQGFGYDDRIELDVAAFKANGWNVGTGEIVDEQRTSEGWYDCAGCADLETSRGISVRSSQGDPFSFNVGAAVLGRYSTVEANTIGVFTEDEFGVLATFGKGTDGEVLASPIVGKGALLSRVSFVNVQPDAPAARDISVIIDQYVDANTGIQQAGAFIDLDKDGVLDANEISVANRAFDSEGLALIDLAANRVTLRMNDLFGRVDGEEGSDPSDTVVALNLSGFGLDDRIEINVNAMARNGWSMEGYLNYTSQDIGSDNSNCFYSDFSGSHCANGTTGQWFSIRAWRDARSAGYSDYHQQGPAAGLNLSLSRSDGATYFCDDFAVLNADNRLIDGQGTLISLISLVRDPLVHLVVEYSGVYFDLDADGNLDRNEAAESNRANAENGLDMDHQTVVVKFNDFPDDLLDLRGFGHDDRIEFDLSALADHGYRVPSNGRVENLRANSYGNSQSWDDGSNEGSRIWRDQYSRQRLGSDLQLEAHYTKYARHYACTQEGRDVESTRARTQLNMFTNDGGYYSLAVLGQFRRRDHQGGSAFYCETGDANHVADLGGSLLARVSFVRSDFTQVLVNHDGGWVDLDQDGVLDVSEMTDANQAFDFSVSEGQSNAVIDLGDDRTVIRFLDIPAQVLDLSGFGEDDRIEIDRTSLGLAGLRGASAYSSCSDQWSCDSDAYATNAACVSNGSGSGITVKAEMDHCSCSSGPANDTNSLWLETRNSSGGAHFKLGDFGDNTRAVHPGNMVSFVTSTIHVVVDASGAFLDTNANGAIDENEFAYAFDPGTGEPTINLDLNTVEIRFKGVPGTPLKLDGFGEDDRILIERAGFHAQGWEGADARESFTFSTESLVVKGFGTGPGERFGPFGTSGFGVVNCQSGCGLSAIAISLGMDMESEEGFRPRLEPLVDPSVQLDFNQIAFVAPSYALIEGFLGDALTLEQRGTFSGGSKTSSDTITVGEGADQILVRLPLVNDNIDETSEKVTLAVTAETGGDSFSVPEASGSARIVDDDSPVITRAFSTVYDRQMVQHYLVQSLDVNNRSGAQDGQNNGAVRVDYNDYFSYTYACDEGAAQPFQVTVTSRGQWEIVLLGDDYYDGTSQANLLTTHNSSLAFRPMKGSEVLSGGVATGAFSYVIDVPAGTRQILMRSAIQDFSTLSTAERTALVDGFGFSSEVTHVDPILVVRETVVDEGDGTASVQVVAVGGDFNNGSPSQTATVNVSTADGQWEDRQFLVVRELASAGPMTIQWAVQSDVSTLMDGRGWSNYVSGYYGQNSIDVTQSDDFILLGGQTAGTNGLPQGSVTFADGQKEAWVTVRVRTDNVGEEREDFRVVLTSTPAGTTYDPNPQRSYAFGQAGSAGYATIANDDQLFVIQGLVMNEGQNSRVEGDDALQQSSYRGLALEGLPAGLTAPTGYTLHQFIIHREGDYRAAASVDWVVRVNGIDGAGGFIETTDPTQAAGAHRAETADFLLYQGDATDAAYDGAYGLLWNAPDGDVLLSKGKTVTFAAGEKEKVVTIAVANDLLAEDAESFTVQLTHPQALPGNEGNPGVSALRGQADFLIGDNDGTTVRVDLSWVANKAGLSSLVNAKGNALANGLDDAGNVDKALYEGTSSDWLTNGDNDYTNDNTDNDRRLVLTFTRSSADATASQAFFEILLGQDNQGSNTFVYMQAEGSTGNSVYAPQHSALWRGSVNFAEGETTATVVIRIPDDNIIESNRDVTVTLFDTEHLPDSVGVTEWDINAGENLQDKADIGFANDALTRDLADWNSTRRDPDAYTATATVVDDDVRLWLDQTGMGGRAPHNIFRSGYWYDVDVGDDFVGCTGTDYTSYDRTPNLWELDGDPAFNPATNTDPAYGDAASQVFVSGVTGDVALTFARAGQQTGKIVLNWEVVLGVGYTADTSDFNPVYWNAVEGKFMGTLELPEASRFNTTNDLQVSIPNLFVPERVVEDNETFDLKFSVASIDNAPVRSGSVDGSNVLFTPDWNREPDGSYRADRNLAGWDTMTAQVVIRNDDVSYGIEWTANSRNGDATFVGNVAKVVEGDDGNTYLEFQVTRDLGDTDASAYKNASSVGWRVVGTGLNLATVSESDFLAASGTVAFSGWQWRDHETAYAPQAVTNYFADGNITDATPDKIRTVRVEIRPDLLVEYGERFKIELYNPSVGYVDPAAKEVSAVIVNDDTGLIVNDFNVTEGDSGVAQVQVTLLRVGDLNDPSEADWSKFNLDTQANDFGTGATRGALNMDSSSGTIEHAMVEGFGVESHTLTLPFAASGDAGVESDENFRVKFNRVYGIDQLLFGDSADKDDGDPIDDSVAALQNASFALTSGLNAGQSVATLQNDDTIFSVAEANVKVTENSGGSFSFTITRSVSVPQDQTVTWSVLDQGGRYLVSGNDFVGGVLPTGTVTFKPGELSKVITVPFSPNPDNGAEADEMFTVEVTSLGAGAENDTFVTSGAGARGVIVNDDGAIFVSDSKAITQKEGTDLDGALVEGDYSYYEFDVVRAGPYSGASTVDWALVLDGTASASDFTGPTRGSLSFSANGTQTVRIKMVPDAVMEGTDTFHIQLSNSSAGVSIVNATGNDGPLEIGKIGDDDYSLTVAQEVPQEGDDPVVETDGRTTIAFTITRVGSIEMATSCEWTLSFPTGSLAASVADFRDISDADANDGVISGSFVFPAGLDTYTINVPVQGDTQWEGDEPFTLTLDYDVGTSTERSTTASGVITNDDEGFSIRPITSASEGDGLITFKVVRQGDLSGSSSVTWTLTGGDTDPVSLTGAGNDFGSALTGSVSFDGTEQPVQGDDGQYYVEKTVTVNVGNDSTYERDEQFVVTLSSPSEGGSLRQDAKAQTGTLLNDDLAYWMAVDKTEVLEGDAGGSLALVTFTLHRTGSASTLASSSNVNWALSLVSGDATALQAADVIVGGQSALSGRTTFDAGSTEKTLTLQFVADGIRELDSVVRMTLSGTGSFLQGEVLGTRATVDITLNDDDDQLTVTAGQGATLAAEAPFEGNPNVDGNTANDFTSYFFNVNRVGSTLGAATVSWTVSTASGYSVNQDDIDSVWIDGVRVTDANLTDSVFGTSTITFADGDDDVREIEVRIKQDRRGEYDEGFTVTLSNPSFGSTLPTPSVTQVVPNDDPILTLSMDVTAVNEGNEEDDRAAVFRITRGGDSSVISSVDWFVSTDDDTDAADEADFGGFLPSGTVTFLEGETTKLVTVLTQGDNVFELAERFSINLANARNADILGDTSLEAVLVNDDVGLVLRAIDSALNEGVDGGETAFRFGLRAEGSPTAARGTVTWHVEGVGMHPTSADDFVGEALPSGTTSINFRNGVGTSTITVNIAGDDVYGASEQFKVVIDSFDVFDARNNALGASIVTGEATATARDDDLLIGLSQATAVVLEGDSGTTELRFYVDAISTGEGSAGLNRVVVEWSLSGLVTSDDFTAMSGEGSLTYDSVSRRYYLPVQIKGDAVPEADERFTMKLLSAHNVDSGGNVEIAKAGSTAAGVIKGDDFGLFLVTPTGAQGEDSARFVFEVVRDGPTDESMDVHVRIGVPYDLTGDGASANDFLLPEGFYMDRDGYIAGDLSFNADQTVERFVLEAVHDRKPENNERFMVEARVTEVGGEPLDTPAVSTFEGTLLTDDGNSGLHYPDAPLPEIPDPVYS
ncbi:MAG: Calx-beta domain-containing protein [Ramlibacter sp.]|uniref:Calx-beta domain-containing protein n=1 Tax=Ramlibacter sp. TaxID=1917967 RepID=UPI002601AEBE|nr:Calx-beta domain-containing protein [Ramlibacter sp.]MDH4377989.1 Calx-beta domain-containing protein [Ramlibacter sp.]